MNRERWSLHLLKTWMNALLFSLEMGLSAQN